MLSNLLLTNLHWHAPWAFLLLLVPALFLLLARLKRQSLLDYADPALRPWALHGHEPARVWRNALHLGAWLCLVAALAGPRLPLDSAPQGDAGQASRQDVRVMALLDVSASMQAQDISPTRLERARLKLHSLPDVLGGESLGLALFAGSAGVVMPPSSDPAVFRYALQQSEHLLDDAPGTELALALEAAARGLPASGDHARAILLVSDGDSAAVRSNAMLQAVEKLREAQIPLFILGMGSEQGAAIPDGAGGYLQLDGQPFLSRMDRAALEEMAQRTDGVFIAVNDGDADLRALAAAIHALPSRSIAGKNRGWNELFIWPLLLGISLLLMAYMPGFGLRRKTASPPLTMPMLAILGLGLSGGMSPDLYAAPLMTSPSSAYAAWQRGDFVQAQLLYARLPGAQARMGEGAAAYRRGDYNHAAQAFTSAWLLADSDTQRADALYNLGNAELLAGRSERAVAAYEQVLRLRPKDENAASNLWLAQQKAEEKRMKSSKPEDPPGRKPTDFARYNEDVLVDFPPDETSNAQGLSAGGAGAGEARKADAPIALNLGEADRLAAEKKMELLDDQPNAVWRAMLRRDTPERKSEGLPW
ncbi:MAG: VWA domain-containing protein [Pseudomonadota bacterium]